jgi:hypothetical protein
MPAYLFILAPPISGFFVPNVSIPARLLCQEEVDSMLRRFRNPTTKRCRVSEKTLKKPDIVGNLVVARAVAGGHLLISSILAGLMHLALATNRCSI